MHTCVLFCITEGPSSLPIRKVPDSNVEVRLCLLMLSVDVLSFSKQILKISHNRILTHPFHFIINKFGSQPKLSKLRNCKSIVR